MKWIKGIGFILLTATVFAIASSLLCIPEEIGGPLSLLVGMAAMVFAIDRWDLV